MCVPTADEDEILIYSTALLHRATMPDRGLLLQSHPSANASYANRALHYRLSS